MGSPNAITNGFEFQYAAAIYIFLKYIKDVKKIGLETGEDIEIILRNDEILFAQAKSSLEGAALHDNDHKSTIIDSLKSLSKNKKKAAELITIFNYHKPFGDDMNVQMGNSYKYNDLSSSVRKYIEENVKGFDIDLSKVSFWLLQFEGENKLLALESEVREQLNGINSITNFRIKDLLDNWHIIMSSNAATKEIFVDGDILCGVLFGNIACAISVEGLFNFLDINDITITEGLSSTFRSYFSKRDLTFKQINTIIGDFINYSNNRINKPSNRNELLRDFITNYCIPDNIPNYITSLFHDYPVLSQDEYSINLFKLITLYCIQKKDLISKINEVFYDNR